VSAGARSISRNRRSASVSLTWMGGRARVLDGMEVSGRTAARADEVGGKVRLFRKAPDSRASHVGIRG
jgi:hypothetical protein